MNPEQLAEAFELFSNVSSQLANTYQAMEAKVGLLNSELHQVDEQRRQELDEKLRVSERYETLLQALPAGVVVLDSRGVITDCNPAAEALLGKPLVGELWRDVIARSFAPEGEDGHEIMLKDGRLISLATRSIDGGLGQLILLNDLTQTRRLQQNLSRHRRLSEMGRMMSSLAHQIRTPLSAAMLYAGHLNNGALSEQQTQRFAGKILSRLNHLEQQVKDMLIFVRGDVKLTDRIRADELVSLWQQAMEVPVAAAGAQCHIANLAPDALVLCNRESMVGALMNLVSNAIEAAGSAAELSISLKQQEQALEIVLLDNGPGIPSELIEQLDEPFFTTKPQGTGLGLAVVKAVCQAHHGEFSLHSAPGAGCTAVIRLPLVATKANQEEARNAS
jgi:two-component system sensor histidine kinase FlrB